MDNIIKKRFWYREESWGVLLQDIKHDRIWAVDKDIFQRMTSGEVDFPVFSDAPYQHCGKFELGNIEAQNSLTSPLSVSWSLTKRCNSDCRFCCTDSLNSSIDMVEADTSKIARVLKTLIQWKVLRIILGGGEPLTRPDIIEVLDVFRKNKYKPVIATNGILLHGEIREAVLRTCMNIQISLDTLNQSLYRSLRGVNALDNVIDNIKETAKSGICMRIVTVITNENLNDLPQLAGFISSCGIKQWFLFDLLESGRGKSCYEELHLDDKTSLIYILDEIKKKHTDISIWFWGNKEADGCAVYVLPDGNLGLIDYHTDRMQIFSAHESNLETASKFWDSVSETNKQKTLDNFLSSNRLSV